MKRIRIFAAVLLTVLLLTACTREAPSTYTVEQAGKIFTVETTAQTISDGTNTYQFQIGRSSGKITITYPDGSTYWWTTQTSGRFSSGYGGWSDDYDETKFIPGNVLVDVLSQDSTPSERSGNPLLGLLLVALGIWHTASPYSAWYLSHGWRFKNAEPSDAALGMTRFGGVAVILFGVILFFV